MSACHRATPGFMIRTLSSGIGVAGRSRSADSRGYDIARADLAIARLAREWVTGSRFPRAHAVGRASNASSTSSQVRGHRNTRRLIALQRANAGASGGSPRREPFARPVVHHRRHAHPVRTDLGPFSRPTCRPLPRCAMRIARYVVARTSHTCPSVNLAIMRRATRRARSSAPHGCECGVHRVTVWQRRTATRFNRRATT